VAGRAVAEGAVAERAVDGRAVDERAVPERAVDERAVPVQGCARSSICLRAASNSLPGFHAGQVSPLAIA
jgi:hypothetical protein